MLIEDPASDEPIDRETANRLFWAKERKKLMREGERWEAEARRIHLRALSLPPLKVRVRATRSLLTLMKSLMRSVTMSKRKLNVGEPRREKRDDGGVRQSA
jgi:hypothetical protein